MYSEGIYKVLMLFNRMLRLILSMQAIIRDYLRDRGTRSGTWRPTEERSTMAFCKGRSWSFEPHFRQLVPRLRVVVPSLGKLMSNLGQLQGGARRLYLRMVQSIAMYGTPVRYSKLVARHYNQTLLKEM